MSGGVDGKGGSARGRGQPEQLALDLGPEPGRWRFSRLVARSRHFARMRARLEFVRRHFPELDGLCIRVGMARKRGVLGWGSLDPERPGIWIRPRRLDYFTVAHEMTHLLQARGELPGGERACDLHALARSPSLVDAVPGYLKLPGELREARRLPRALAVALCSAARRALAARAAGRRDYLRAFERAVEGVDAGLRAGRQSESGRRAPRGEGIAAPRGASSRGDGHDVAGPPEAPRAPRR